MLASTRALLCALSLLVAFPATAQIETLLRPASAAGDQCAFDLDIDGDRLLVGRPYDDTAGPEAGAALVYDYVNGAWSLSATLLPPTTTGFELAGSAVALDGDRAVLGGYFKATYTGIVHVYERTGTAWSLTAPGRTGRLIFVLSALSFHPITKSQSTVAMRTCWSPRVMC